MMIAIDPAPRAADLNIVVLLAVLVLEVLSITIQSGPILLHCQQHDYQKF